MKSTKGKVAEILNQISGQEQKIAKAQKRIDDLQHELSGLLSAQIERVTPSAELLVDNHNYCGKILYASKKAANSARKLINRDLVKAGKPQMRRSYFCERCEAWHLTSVPSWSPYPENENSQLVNQ